MCGRYSLAADKTTLSMSFPGLDIPDDMPLRYNIAPTQHVPVIANLPEPRLEFFHWGLIPSWAKDAEIGNRMINARAETLLEKPSFRNAFRRRRCLIPAEGFYEWQRSPDGKIKTPMHIRLKSGRPFAFAGLWEQWLHPGGSEIWSCTIITTEPNDLMASIHNRMPVILRPEDYAQWLSSGERQSEALQALLVPYESDEMTAYAVTKVVNHPGNDTPACLEPAGDA